MPDPRSVQSMFGRIAGRYDLLNRLLSAGIDQRWRRAAVGLVADRLGGDEHLAGARGVDFCCGTGDLALAFRRAGARVAGFDFTPEMLPLARDKGAGRGAGAAGTFLRGDAMAAPAVDGGADFASVSFGIRNVADRLRCLEEMARVVRPRGVVLVLEFTMPPGAILGRLYRLYFTRILPTVGRLVSKDDDAYSYLPRTVLAWPDPDAFQAEFEAAGLVDCGFRRLTRGIACLHWGRVPELAGGAREVAAPDPERRSEGPRGGEA